MSESVLFWYDLESKSDDELCVKSLVTHCKVKSVLEILVNSRTDRPSKDIRRGVQSIDNDNLTDFNM